MNNKKSDLNSVFSTIKPYQSVYQDNIICKDKPVVKAIAYYLPQFHAFKENNEWWGEGFTEWTNTRKCIPRYWGHYQPREPHEDIGYYNLLDIDTLKKQSELAKQHGIYGFCMYYYWFSGKKLMEKPLELLLKNKNIDIKFCLCWANENWTRRWDGLEKDILIEQKYSDNDPEQFIKDIAIYLKDERYIKYNNKPIILVYNPSAIPNIKVVFSKWKEIAQKIGIGEISIWICNTNGSTIDNMNLFELVDKEVMFPPHNIATQIISKQGDVEIYDYKKIKYIKNRNTSESSIDAVMLAWDNSPRRFAGFHAFDNFSIYTYYKWLRRCVDDAVKNKKDDSRYVFINAWNEWAEGTYLEPDKKYGYTNINTTSLAICQKDFTIKYYNKKKEHIKCRIAVQIHLYYPEMINEMIDYVNNISEPYDCYITTCDIERIEEIFSLTKRCTANYIEVQFVSNRGRDVRPLFLQMHDKYNKYEYMCHIHTKKSKHKEYGDVWRKYLLDNLLGSVTSIKEIIGFFDNNKTTGLIYPERFSEISKSMNWSEDKKYARYILKTIGLYINIDQCFDFPAGNMLWFRTKSVYQLFDQKLLGMYPEEKGQKDGTIMHAVERLWPHIARYNHYTVKHMTFSKDNKMLKSIFVENELRCTLSDNQFTESELRMSYDFIHSICDIELHSGLFEYYFKNKNINKVVVYGVGVYGKILIRILKQAGVKIVAAVDRMVDNYCGLHIIRPDMVIPECDLFIISMHMPHPEIENEYRERGVNNIITFRDIVKDIQEHYISSYANDVENSLITENIYERFRFPFDAVSAGSKIIIYGGGIVGKIFLRQIAKSSYCNIVAICDKNPNKTGIVEVPLISLAKLSSMRKVEYDKIIIAIEKKNIAMEIMKELEMAGIIRNKIIWIDPSICTK